MTELTKQKVTIYFQGAFGTQKIEAREWGFSYGKYAQYSNACNIAFKQPRKRKSRLLRETSHPSAVVVEGWGHPDPQSPWTQPEETATGCIVRKSRHSCFSPEYGREFNGWFDRYVAESNANVLLDNRQNNAYQAPTSNPPELDGYADVNPF